MDSKEEIKKKDICQTCEHHWLDFPMPLDRYISRCEVLDNKYLCKEMDEVVPYPCLECPFNRYSKKKGE